MTGAIMISWGAPVRGREAKGLEVFGKALARYDELAKQGRIHGHKEFFAVNGTPGRLAGFMLVEGELEELSKLQLEPEQQRLQIEAQAITENFSVLLFAGGSEKAVQERVTDYLETARSLGLM